MINLLKKISSLIVKLFFSKVPYDYKYYIRDTYVCRFWQLKYFFRDYILKKPYKEIRFDGEFGAEMQFCLPFLYWHHLNGTLKKTASFGSTKEIYFFSPNHAEDSVIRTNEGNYNFELPRVLYSHNYNMHKWKQVPLKAQYQNQVYVYDKPLLILANRYNTEWDGEPVSFYSVAMLDQMIIKLKQHYQIVYNRPLAQHIVNDNSLVKDLNEFDWLKTNHPEVLLIQDLFDKNEIKANNFNHFQLCLYANCNRFISIHGGTSVLASYFGGKNIIYSTQGPEHYFNCYQKLYPKLSGTEIYHAKTEQEVLSYVNLYTN